MTFFVLTSSIRLMFTGVNVSPNLRVVSSSHKNTNIRSNLTCTLPDMYKSIAWFTFCTVCASLKDRPPCQDSCETGTTLQATLGSSVLLPCSAPPGLQAGWVLWVKHAEAPLVNLTSGGQVQFLEPRQGRLKTFPNEGYVGNFSIRIDAVQESDLGCYQCGQPAACHQVEVRKHRKHDADLMLALCIAGGVTACILSACVCCYCARSRHKVCFRSPGEGVNRQEENGEPDPAATGQSADAYLGVNQEPDPHVLPAEYYENEQDQNESVAPCRAVGGHPRVARTRGSTERKHALLQREMIGRLQRTTRHFYVNQDEINQQTISAHKDRPRRASLWRKKTTTHHRYENPIYNSTHGQVPHH